MPVNAKTHVVNQMLELDDLSKIDIGVHLIVRDKNKEDYYFSRSVEVEEKIKIFLRDHIRSQLLLLKNDDMNEPLPVKEYNQELALPDYMARFNLKKFGEENKAVKNLKLLNKAMAKDALEDLSKVKFQIITLIYGGKKLSFCFYRGTKKNAKTIKVAMFTSKEFKEIKSEMIEFGGKIAFFMDDTDLYIIDPKSFEYAFDYRDHISEISGENLEKITSMKFFTDEETRDNFKNASSHHLLARGLANIKPETLKNVGKHFGNRIEELRKIKTERDKIKDKEKKKLFESKMGELNNLIDCIDFKNNSIIFNEQDDPKPLLHFFQDKIVESFLTKEIRVMIGLQ
ncbi:Kiwa anti-phage protein KwaB-like domain-containing protein [Sporosarcina sp. SG10008]|uniref:Kiwa anti-phage protein KwaB-like domain-containing protein n=1 Tax=Sporosarcina sp. SG10008 TaxID=3373103 RepID=UPI0037DD7494